MRLALCSLLLGSAAALLGQSQPQSSQTQNHVPAFVSPTTLPLLRPLGVGCPVGMKAERQASGQREWIVSLEDALQVQRPNNTTRANNAGVHVDLVGFRSKPMRQAEVAVYYIAPGVHSLLVDQAGDATLPASDLKKTFVLSAADGESHVQLAGSLLVGNAASITRVQLLSVEYSDGSTWQTNGASSCTVEPGLLMAVSSH